MINNTGALQLVGIPTGSPSKITLVSASAAAGLGPFASVIYVDQVRGSDATGARGNANLPFATIQAAVNAALTDDVIQLAPQRFALAASITIPATVVRIVFTGWRAGWVAGASTSAGLGTQVRCATAHAFNLGANLGLTKCAIENMTVATGDAGSAAIFAQGTLYAVGTFLSAGLYTENLDISTTGQPINLKYVFVARLVSTYLNGSAGISLQNCTGVTLLQVNSATMGWTVTYNLSDPLTPQFQATLRVERGTTVGGQSAAGFLSLGGTCQVFVDQTSLLGGLKGNAAVPLAVSGAPVAACGVACLGYFGGSNSGILDFASAGSELPDTATALVFDFRGTRFYGVGGTSLKVDGQSQLLFKVGGAAANFQTVKLDDTVTLPACTISAQAKIHITGRRASWPTVVLTTPDADEDIIPPMLSGTIDLSAGAAAVAKSWVALGYAGFVRAGAAPDSAFLTSAAQLADAVITARTTAGLTMTATAAVGNVANWQAVWN